MLKTEGCISDNKEEDETMKDDNNEEEFVFCFLSFDFRSQLDLRFEFMCFDFELILGFFHFLTTKRRRTNQRRQQEQFQI